MKKTLILLLLVFFSSHPDALGQNQSVQVQGVVIDGETGMPIPGANVIENGTTNGVLTDFDGQYAIEVAVGSSITVSYLGYSSYQFTVNSQTNVDITLQPESSALDEVIVIGYGTQRKSDLTGAVSSVSADELNEYPTVSATQALQGRASGVSVTSSNGEPGAAPVIRVRGGTSINASSDPLFVVDGFAGATPPPAGNIASIEILKDASATAIYGSRGANGVVLITTKSGSEGKTQINLRTSYSFHEVDQTLNLLNGQQFAQYINELYLNDGNDSGPYENPASYGEGTDWQDAIFRSGAIENYELSASGGNEGFRFYTSANYYGQQGIVLNSNYERLSGLVNIDFDASDWVEVGAKMMATRTERDGVRTQESSGGTSGAGVIGAAMKFEPTQGIYDEDGNFTTSNVGDPHDNPVAVATQRTNNSVNDMLQANAFANFSLLENLTFRTTFGLQINNNRSGSYVPQTLVEGRNTQGSGSINNAKNTNFINENYLNYQVELSDIHSINVMGGYSYQSYRGESSGASNREFISDGFSFWNLGGGTNFQSPSSSLTEWELSSFYGRLNYSLLDKYLFTFTGRYDGSSRFGANNKWAFFPSGAVAWNLGRETFMQDLGVFSNLKIRGSYGVTGNTEIGSYRSLAGFSSTLAVTGGNQVNAVRPTRVANENLSWESTQQTDIGVDFGFFNDRLNITLDYYYKLTEDLLYEVPLPQYSGYASTLQNIGSVENKGWEFSFNSLNFDGAFSWTSDFNISFNKNEIRELPGGQIFYSTVPSHMLANDSQVLREGEVVGAFYGWIFDGLYQQGDDFSADPGKQPGDVKYLDINGRDADNNLTGQPDGVINSDDRTIIGDPHPDFTFGFRNDFAYGNFDLSLFFQGSYGNDMLNFTRMELDWMAGKSNATIAALDRWTPSNTDTNVPRASGANKPEVSTRWVEDGSYIRLKNIALGYNLNQAVLQSLGVDRFRIFLSGQNLITWTDYSGYDPEVSYQGSNRNIGLDYGSYPNVKAYTIGLNVTF